MEMTGTIFLFLIIVIFMAGAVLWLIGERGVSVLPSTRKFIVEGGFKKLFDLNTLHGYIYMRWQKPYLSFFINQLSPNSTKAQGKWFANRYHSKVLTEEHARSIITIGQEIRQKDLEQIVPYPIARNIVLNAPPKITLYVCGCRHARKNPCQPTQVCMFIGEPFASFMLEHHPTESRAINQTEALELLRAEHERGHIHAAWFKNAMLDRMYVICNCCICCCGGIEAMMKYGTPMIASSGYVASVNEGLCQACGTCVEKCPFDALSVDQIARVNWDKCMGCGVCIDQCPNDAISLLRDAQNGIPLDVKALQTETMV